MSNVNPPPMARLGDLCKVVCHNHSKDRNYDDAEIITGSGSSTCDGRPIARLGDVVEAPCGHKGKIVTGSGVSTCDERPMARLGDQIGDGDLEGEIITGSPTSTTI